MGLADVIHELVGVEGSIYDKEGMLQTITLRRKTGFDEDGNVRTSDSTFKAKVTNIERISRDGIVTNLDGDTVLTIYGPEDDVTTEDWVVLPDGRERQVLQVLGDQDGEAKRYKTMVTITVD